MLKVFTGFQLDVAADFTGLKHSQIDRLRKNGVIKPTKTSTGYCYSFQDLLTLRLVRQLLLNDVTIGNITKAHDYLTGYSPEQNLANIKLYVSQETKEILYIGDPSNDEKQFLVSMNRYGQMVLKGLVTILPVGRQLEGMRRDVIKLDKQLDKGLKAVKVVSLDTLRKKYG